MKPLRKRGSSQMPDREQGDVKFSRTRRRLQDMLGTKEAVELLESGDPNSREKGLSALRIDKPALVSRAMSSTFKDVRLAAVQGLKSDVEALEYIAQNSGYDDSRMAAQEMMYLYLQSASKDELMALARTCRSRNIRFAAVEELNARGDEGTLAYVAVSSRFPDTKELAMSFL